MDKNKILQFYKEKKIVFIISVIAFFAMGVINLITSIINFSWFTLSMSIMSFILFVGRIIQYFAEKNAWKIGQYFTGSITTILLIGSMSISFFKMVTDLSVPKLMFEWLVYIYALFGTLRLALAIRGIIVAKRDTSHQTIVNSWIDLIAGLYMFFLMEYVLITIFSRDAVAHSMFILMVVSEAIIYTVSIAILILLLVKGVKENKKEETLVQ